MSDARTCPKCGGEMPPDAVDGLCARCLARVAFGEAQAQSPAPKAEERGTIKVAPEPDPLREAGGSRIGRYKLLEKIGEGGFGLVYMAEQVEPVQRKVALKIIKAGMDTHAVIARFEAERQALALMDHPNIAKVLDAGATETGRPYFVMELVKGIPITSYCDQYRLSPAERLALFIQVCHAVQHAHQKGIIHRDIKPSNVLVTLHDGTPVPKVIDFGIAKALSQKLTEKTLFTGFGQMIGTPAYMSPEQADLSGLDVDTRSDIYSLGALLYELLTGVTPFDKETLARAAFDEVRRMIRETEPPKPSTRLLTLGEKATEIAQQRHVDQGALSRLVRGDLDWIVMKCLEKDRTRRYETANGLAHDIERHLGNEPVAARPASRLYRFQKLVRRNKLAFAAAGAVTAALVIGLGLSTWSFFREKAARRRAVAAEAMQNQLRQQAEAGEKKARTEASKSRQVAQVLKSALEGVGPSVALGRDTTMLREIMDKTVERLRQDLKDQPDVEAELRNTIGEVYRALGLYQKAEQMHRQALQLRRGLWGQMNAEVATSLDNLGMALALEDKLTDAGLAFREALNIRTNVLGQEHADIATSLNNLAALRQMEGNSGEAEAAERGALAMRRKLFGNEHPDVCESLLNLAITLTRESKLAEAETCTIEALAIRRKLSGDEHPDTAYVLGNLALISRNQGKWAEAENMGREVLAIWRKLVGNEHPRVAEAANNLAQTLADQGKLAEAEAINREVLAMRRKLLGDKHSEVGQSLNNLAVILQREGKLAEAESFQRQALALQRELQGEKHPDVALALNNLGRVLRNEGKLAEAEATHRQALALQREVLGEKHPQIALSLYNLANVYRDQSRLVEAASLHREALTMRRALFGDGHPNVALSLESVALVLCEQAQPVEAEAPARECLAIREKKLPNDWRTFSAHSAVGHCLLEQKKYAEAEPFLLAGYQGMKQREQTIPADSRSRLKDTAQDVARLYEALGKTDEAAKWKALK